MTAFPCPICGDPTVYRMWMDNDPPDGCPYGAATVAQCVPQMAQARQEAERRKIAPHCFDGNGKMLPGKMAEVFDLWMNAGRTR